MTEAKKTFKVLEFTADYLKQNPEKLFTFREIAEAIVELHPEEARNKRETSTVDLSDNALVLQVQAQIGAAWRAIEKKHDQIVVVAGRPMKFYWTNESIDYSDEESLKEQTFLGLPRLAEKELYPALKTYLETEKSVFSMRIDEKRSSSKGGSGSSHWLHPDLVGISLLSREWGKESQQLSKYYINELIKVWSFEVKVHLSIANVRSSFFQTVSNSSWANYGYLVAESIDQRALEEIEILSNDHGIGLIILNLEDLSQSTVMLQAREKPNLSWSSINRLAKENKDFSEFLRGLEKLHQTADIDFVSREFAASFN
jgi:hypothetical protein